MDIVKIEVDFTKVGFVSLKFERTIFNLYSKLIRDIHIQCARNSALFRFGVAHSDVT